MRQGIYRLFIELTNRKWSSLLLGRFARSAASKRLIPSFAKVYHINQAEMEKELNQYGSLHEFFTRRLKTDARAIEAEPLAVVSPVDAVLEDIGPIEPTHEIYVKGKVYSIAEMLGGEEAAMRYAGGTYMVLYLSPSHYHRIHSPVSGKISKQWTLGTRSYPVNRLGLKYGKDTLAKNFRTITEMEHAHGRIVVVKVGAMFVNSIEAVHKGDTLEKGEEMAYFTFGSTVVLLFEKDTFVTTGKLKLPLPIKMGEKLGFLKP
ncbi:phosphatidylserine decarboxylase [Mesobacillus zeae]|uniref:Phosphatidylserine decarboxylase proenzyme n=1 Tax=Mesobacillus zeae TaxID=1917180 RepID=A0A398B297_9BACI|nr:phosphatidylserine decarboxylase [Mesobacillus zeae]RID83771.1 phosphatidylserine decarboxylase [Mesobacillus zeae]